LIDLANLSTLRLPKRLQLHSVTPNLVVVDLAPKLGVALGGLDLFFSD
jgi:hypothetical protein